MNCTLSSEQMGEHVQNLFHRGEYEIDIVFVWHDKDVKVKHVNNRARGMYVFTGLYHFHHKVDTWMLFEYLQLKKQQHCYIYSSKYSLKSFLFYCFASLSSLYCRLISIFVSRPSEHSRILWKRWILRFMMNKLERIVSYRWMKVWVSLSSMIINYSGSI